MSDTRLRSLVRRGVLVPVSRGVYARAAEVAVAGRRPGGEHAVQLAAALAITGPAAVASHESAAILHGLDLLGRVAPGVTVTRPPCSPGSRTQRDGICLHTAALPAQHMTRRDRIRVTSVARTVVDLARRSSFRAGVVTADSALHRGRASAGELEAVLADCARWPGIRQARRVVAFSDGRSESVFESLSRVVFREQGLPAPELQVWVGGDDGMIGRADFLWRRYRTIGEADGALKYADPDRARTQLQRDAMLREAGFEVVHFTWPQITRAPAQVAASIRAAFRRGGRPPGG